MSENNASSAVRGDVLQRGKACIRCRRRKMKCDGRRPICTPCIDANREDDCEYTDVQSLTRTQLLEENVARLESRLQELESGQSSSSSLTLHDPYAASRLSTVRQGEGNASQFPRIPLLEEAWWDNPEPSDQLSDILISIFLPNSGVLGFALDADRFRECASLPSSRTERPHSALLNSVYLWALRLTNTAELREREDIYLQRAILALQGSTFHHQGGYTAHHRVQAVQAEVLIALYFLCLGHDIEARYHVNAAVTFALSCSLHQIKASSENLTSLSLPPPRNAKERTERIRMFWTVFDLDSCWSGVLESPRSLLDDTSRGTQIDTPWSEEPATETLGRTVWMFLSGATISGDDVSYLTYRSKASAIYGKASDLSARVHFVTHTEEDVEALAQFATGFARRLPPLDELDASRGDIRLNMAVTHSIVHASMIHLHRAFTSATQAASGGIIPHAVEIISILEFASRSYLSEGEGRPNVFFDPFLAVCGFMAGQVLTEEIDRSIHGPRTHEARSKRQTCLLNLGRLLNELRKLAGSDTFPIFSQRASMIEDELSQDVLQEMQEIDANK